MYGVFPWYTCWRPFKHEFDIRVSVGFPLGFVLAGRYIMTQLPNSSLFVSGEESARDAREAVSVHCEVERGELLDAGRQDSPRVGAGCEGLSDLEDLDGWSRRHGPGHGSSHDPGGCGFCGSSRSVKDLGKWLVHVSGGVDHEFRADDLYIVSRALAFHDDEGRRALGMFSLLGDAALTYAVVDTCFSLRYSKSRASDARSKCTAWSALARVFVRGVPGGLVQFPANVDPGTTRSGGEALEALAGLVARDLGRIRVDIFARNVGVYSSYKFE